jgi:hypothetical protein
VKSWWGPGWVEVPVWTNRQGAQATGCTEFKGQSLG